MIQSVDLLSDLCRRLSVRGCRLIDNTIRTWFFVQNVDVNYEGFVSGRNVVFDDEGLVVSTHSIASTAIQGRVADHRVAVAMDCYTIKGVAEGQVSYLYGASHLSSTHDYGVRFERGTKVTYGDRSHIFISGTASIDSTGEVVHKGDIKAQTLRMWENVEVLLSEGGATYGDVAYMVVYLRDMTDMPLVKAMFYERFERMPMQFVLAPVCRPEWLIEMECMAVTPDGDGRFRSY